MRRFVEALLLASLGLNIWLLAGQSLPGFGGTTAVDSDDLGFDTESVLSRSNLDQVFRGDGKALTAADVQLLFDSGEFSDAIVAWQLLAKDDAVEAQRLKQKWIAIARDWLAQDIVDLPERLLAAWLQKYPYDLTYSELQAHWLVATGQRLAAIEQYYALMGEVPTNQQGRYINPINTLVDAEVKALSEQQAWRPLIRFLERLLWHEPQHPPYILMLAQAHIELAEYRQAQTLLRSILLNEFFTSKAEALLEKIEVLNLQAVAIELTPVREHYLVGGEIDQRQGVELLIDTGASISVLSRRYFETVERGLAPEFVRMGRINTAGGMVEAPIFRFEEFAVGDYRVRDIEFVVMELEERSSGDGLLGMNFLRVFSFQIDQGNNLLLLEPR